MADNEVTLEISVDASGATKDIKKFGTQAEMALSGVPEAANKASKSIDNIGDSSKSAGKEVGGFGSRLKDIVGGLGIYEGLKASFRGISNFLTSSVDEAKESQIAFNELTQSLIRAGTYSDANIKSFTDYSKSLSKLTAIDDDVIDGQLAIALNFAKTDEQAKKLVTAATDLSAATGITLDDAIQHLGKTLDGTAGRFIESVPALRGVSEESLKAGAAIDIVGKAFEGAGEAKAKTFEGSINALKIAFGNLQETVGFMIIENDTLNSALQGTTEVINDMKDGLSDSGDSFKSVKKYIGDAAEAAIVLATPITWLVNGFLLLENAIFDGIQAFIDLGKIIWSIIDGILDAFVELTMGIGQIFDLFDGMESITKDPFKVTIDTKDAINSLSNFKKEMYAAKKETEKPIKTGGAGIGMRGASTPSKTADNESAVDNLGNLLKQQNRDFEKQTNEEQKTNQELQSSREDSPLTSATDFAKNTAIDMTADVGARLIKAPLQGAIAATGTAITSTIANIGKGAAGAAPVIADTLSAAVGGSLDQLFGGDFFSKAIKGILDLASDPKAISGLIDGFIKAIPLVISSFIEAIPIIIRGIVAALPAVFQGIIQLIPVLFKSLAEAIPGLFTVIATYLPDLIIVLAESIPLLITAIADNIDIIIIKLIAALPRVVLAIAQGVITAAIAIVTRAIPNVIKGISDGIGSWFEDFGSQFQTFFKDLFDKIWANAVALITSPFTTISDGITETFDGIKKSLNDFFEPVVKFFKNLTGGENGPRFLTNTKKEVGSWFGMATGGVVPSGYPNDSYPASLSSGELVLPPQTTGNLFSMIDEMASGKSPASDNTETNNLLRQLIALIASQSTEVNVQLDRNTLAKAILTLNKDNRRLA